MRAINKDETIFDESDNFKIRWNIWKEKIIGITFGFFLIILPLFVIIQSFNPDSRFYTTLFSSRVGFLLVFIISSTVGIIVIMTILSETYLKVTKTGVYLPVRDWFDTIRGRATFVPIQDIKYIKYLPGNKEPKNKKDIILIVYKKGSKMKRQMIFKGHRIVEVNMFLQCMHNFDVDIQEIESSIHLL